MEKKFEFQMPKMPVEFTKNSYGLRIKKCCASCKYKTETRLINKRKCKMYDLDVCPCDCCKMWKMNTQLVRVGKGEKEEVKRYEYLMYVLEEQKEYLSIERNDTPETEESLEAKIREIRMKFEQEQGTIYIKH